VDISPSQFNQLYPVSTMDIYPGNVLVIHRKALRPNSPHRGNRRDVKGFSRSSRINLAFLVSACPISFSSLLTLTYLDAPLDLREAKNHLAEMLCWLKRIRGTYSYVWFIEFTKAGQPHFHILCSIEAKHIDNLSFGLKWASIIGAANVHYSSLLDRKERTVFDAVVSVHAHKSAIQEIRKPDGAKRYALKYALKLEQKRVPALYRNPGRFWGNSYDAIPKPVQTDISVTEDELRDWLGTNHRANNMEILPKVIWI